MENTTGSQDIKRYSWSLEPESKPILRELNLKSFRKRQNVYLAIAVLAIPFAFYMSYVEFQESLRTSIYGALGIGVLLLALWIALLLALRTKAFFPESMHLSVYENGKKELVIDRNRPVVVESWTKVGETETNTIIQITIAGVQCFVPIPTSIYEQYSRT